MNHSNIVSTANYQNIVTSIIKSQSISISITKSQKYFNKYCNISKVLK